MLKEYGITPKPITVRNPQANAICKQVHQVIEYIIRTFELQTNYLDEDNPWESVLSATAFAIRCTYHTTLQTPPRQVVFGKDLVFKIKYTANWEVIRQMKQQLNLQNNKRENIMLVTKPCYTEVLKTSTNNLIQVRTQLLKVFRMVRLPSR